MRYLALVTDSAVKDSFMADQTDIIEKHRGLSSDESRKLIRDMIEARYALE